MTTEAELSKDTGLQPLSFSRVHPYDGENFASVKSLC